MNEKDCLTIDQTQPNIREILIILTLELGAFLSYDHWNWDYHLLIWILKMDYSFILGKIKEPSKYLWNEIQQISFPTLLSLSLAFILFVSVALPAPIQTSHRWCNQYKKYLMWCVPSTMAFQNSSISIYPRMTPVRALNTLQQLRWIFLFTVEINVYLLMYQMQIIGMKSRKDILSSD